MSCKFKSYLGTQVAFRTSLLRNSRCDRCWSEGDSKPQVFGFLFEPLDLLVLITLLIIFHRFVYVLLAVFEHAIDQPRPPMRMISTEGTATSDRVVPSFCQQHGSSAAVRTAACIF